MKIGMVSDTFLPVLGGAEIHIYQLSCQLREIGWEVTIFTNTEYGEDLIDGISIIRTRLPKKLRALHNFMSVRNFLKEILSLIWLFKFMIRRDSEPLLKQQAFKQHKRRICIGAFSADSNFIILLQNLFRQPFLLPFPIPSG